MEPYAPRALHRLGALIAGEWDIKQYAVVHQAEVFDEARFRAALPLAIDVLPSPARTAERPGAGFVIFHQGRTVDYLVLAWWDRENELPPKVFVNERHAGSWRPAVGAESVCVWDLELIWAEREAYVRTVLSRDPQAGREQYLACDAVDEVLTARNSSPFRHTGSARWPHTRISSDAS